MSSKRNFLVLLLFLFAYTLSSANEKQLCDSANSLYEKGKYSEAVNCYEKIVKKGLTSWKLHFNLGNAYYKKSDLGKAIFHYEIANKLEPGNSDIKTNLSIANSKITDKIEIKENFLLSNIKGNIVGLFTTDGWAWLSIAMCFVACILFLLFYLSKSASIRRTTFWIGLITIVFFISSLSIGFASVQYECKKSNGIVLSKICQVKNSPSENSNAVFSLHEGTKVFVLEKTEEWVSIQLSNGNEGWVKSNELGLF